jgi:hypothetical protein
MDGFLIALLAVIDEPQQVQSIHTVRRAGQAPLNGS